MRVDQAAANVNWKRSTLTVLVVGFFTVFVNAALDGELPRHSAQWWLVFVTGLLVITVISTVFESVYLAKKRDADDMSS